MRFDLELLHDFGQALIPANIDEGRIREALRFYEEPYSLESEELAFWEVLEKLEAIGYLSTYLSLVAIVVNSESHYAGMRSKVNSEIVEAAARLELIQKRAREWELLGPECGPEKCRVEDCSRLRIKLAVYCFVHQMLLSDTSEED